jgi:hypothetical protein
VLAGDGRVISDEAQPVDADHRHLRLHGSQQLVHVEDRGIQQHQAIFQRFIRDGGVHHANAVLLQQRGGEIATGMRAQDQYIGLNRCGFDHAVEMEKA